MLELNPRYRHIVRLLAHEPNFIPPLSTFKDRSEYQKREEGKLGGARRKEENRKELRRKEQIVERKYDWLFVNNISGHLHCILYLYS